MAAPKTVLIIGANGYIGSACARAFARASYKTLGLTRSPNNTNNLLQNGIKPVIGSAADLRPTVANILAQTKTLDVIVVASEQWPDYVSHFNDTVELLIALAKLSNSAGVRPLVLFSSGCKDYGSGRLDGAPGLAPHVETTPLNPPAPLVPRTENALRIFDHKELFDAVVTRPTNVHGGSSSYYGLFLEMAAAAKEKDVKLVLLGDPRVIAHSLHVDDCGEAYVAIAEHPDRSKVAGESFNISASRYETLAQIGAALEKEFGLEGGVKCTAPPQGDTSMTGMLFGWSQWVGSEKLMKLTGWHPSRPMFAEGIIRYKAEYEGALEAGDEAIGKVQGRFGDVVDQLVPAKAQG